MEGVTVLDLIRRNAGRTISMHVKPFSKKNPDAYLGADELEWPAIMTAAESTGGIEWYIIEYEREGVPPLESLKANFDSYKKLRSVRSAVRDRAVWGHFIDRLRQNL